MIFNDQGLVQDFEVADGVGQVWEVFEIKDGQIQAVSRIRSGR